MLSTGQHGSILKKSLDVFGLKLDDDLKIMSSKQSLSSITSKCILGIQDTIQNIKPSVIVAQGDTTTTFVSSLAAFYNKIPFMHVEAGLRTNSIQEPFPEEFNRRATSLITTHHYAPTDAAKHHLLTERIHPNNIFVTGNTGIDAVQHIAEKTPQSWYQDSKEKIILVTTHRRENWGQSQINIAKALSSLSKKYMQMRIVICLHPNPEIRETISPYLENHPNVDLIDAPDYCHFVKLMQRSSLILTDSGGIQEEAPSFGIPVLVLREKTERPEGLYTGNARLIGTDEEVIFRETSYLLDSESAYTKMSNASTPYGDGRAAARIRYLLLKYLNIDSPKEELWIPSKQ